jgi:hypothetical protein
VIELHIPCERCQRCSRCDWMQCAAQTPATHRWPVDIAQPVQSVASPDGSVNL